MKYKVHLLTINAPDFRLIQLDRNTYIYQESWNYAQGTLTLKKKQRTTTTPSYTGVIHSENSAHLKMLYAQYTDATFIYAENWHCTSRWTVIPSGQGIDGMPLNNLLWSWKHPKTTILNSELLTLGFKWKPNETMSFPHSSQHLVSSLMAMITSASFIRWRL